MNLELTVRTGT